MVKRKKHIMGTDFDNTLIHVGYHKTASTFLQTNVFPKMPVNFVMLDEAQLKWIRSVHAADLNKFRLWFDKEISENGEKTNKINILSHEALSGHPHGYEQETPFQISQNLAKMFPNAKILVIIRNQFNYIMSLYTYRVSIKGHEYRSFEKFMEEEGEKGLYKHLEYHALVENYQRLFGVENVLVLPVELLSRAPDQFIKKMLIL